MRQKKRGATLDFLGAYADIGDMSDTHTSGSWVVDGKGCDRDFGRVIGGEVAWVRGACRTPAPEGAEWFATREAAHAAACEEV